MTATETQMPLIKGETVRPTGGVNSAMRDLNMSAKEVAALLDDGSLRGFNIAANPRGIRELRILTASIGHYLAAVRNKPWLFCLPENQRMQIEPGATLLDLLLPHQRPFVLGTELQFALNCGSNLVMALFRTQQIKLIEDTKWKAGPAGSPLATRESVEQLLKARLL
jgi:hypothetical protein